MPRGKPMAPMKNDLIQVPYTSLPIGLRKAVEHATGVWDPRTHMDAIPGSSLWPG